MFFEKVGIEGLLKQKVWKSRVQNKKIGKRRKNGKSRANLKACFLR